MLTVIKQCKISVVKKASLEQEYWQEPPVTTFPINLSDKCATASSLMLHAQAVISECGWEAKKGPKNMFVFGWARARSVVGLDNPLDFPPKIYEVLYGKSNGK